jgi:hypothetical protein
MRKHGIANVLEVHKALLYFTWSAIPPQDKPHPLAREYSTFGDLERHDRGMATQHKRHMYYTIQESVEFIKYG